MEWFHFAFWGFTSVQLFVFIFVRFKIRTAQLLFTYEKHATFQQYLAHEGSFCLAFTHREKSQSKDKYMKYDS